MILCDRRRLASNPFGAFGRSPLIRASFRSGSTELSLPLLGQDAGNSDALTAVRANWKAFR
jgi:hypothetical protein